MIRLETIGDLQKAGTVARVFVLQDVSLVEFTARRSMPYSRDTFPRLQLETKTESAGELQPDGQGLGVQVSFVVSAASNDAPATAPHVHVAGTLALDYARAVKDAPMDPTSIEVFARINGVYNAWPYMREIVSNAFSRLGYPRLTLESLVINPKPPEPGSPTKKPKAE